MNYNELDYSGNTLSVNTMKRALQNGVQIEMFAPSSHPLRELQGCLILITYRDGYIKVYSHGILEDKLVVSILPEQLYRLRYLSFDKMWIRFSMWLSVFMKVELPS